MDLKNERLDRYISKLKNFFSDKLVGILIYGSMAKGNQDSESDIDLIVVILDLPPIEDRFKLIRDILGLNGIGIDAIWLTPGEITRMCSNKHPLILNAFSEGKILSEQDGYLSELKAKLDEDLRQKGVIETDIGWIWHIKRPGEEIIL